MPFARNSVQGGKWDSEFVRKAGTLKLAQTKAAVMTESWQK